MEQSMPVLRNFIRKGSNVILQNQDAFKTNLLQLLFYLVNEIYKKYLFILKIFLEDQMNLQVKFK
jgi:hypothetical protein